MSEESDAAEKPTTDVHTTDEAKKEAEQARLAKTFRLIAGEEVLLTKRPSTFAFLGMLQYCYALKAFLCRLRSIATLTDHFVRCLSVRHTFGVSHPITLDW